jgi:CreA protein
MKVLLPMSFLMSHKIGSKIMKKIAIALMAALTFSAHAEEIANVSTSWNLVGSNDRITIEAFDDPKVPGVTCHLSRAVTGGVAADIGLGSDPSNSSIACRQIGPISMPAQLPKMEKVFEAKQSIFFKTMHVMRVFDAKRNVLIYLVYSDKLIEGSRKNSISTVPVQKW